MSLPSTANRVRDATADQINDRIRESTVERLSYYGSHPEEIDDRLAELDAEWDIERTLMANASALILITSVLGIARDRRFFVMPIIIAGFLFQHALQGWCPPIPVFRRLGIRTQREIDAERYALQAIRDDL